MNQESATADEPLPLNPATVACVALMRLAEMTPESAWEAMGSETRKDWLQIAVLPHSYSGMSWRGMPPECHRRLRTTLRWITAFLASAGADLLG